MAGILNNALNVIPAIMSGSYSFFPGSAYIAIGTSGLAFDATSTMLGSERDRNLINTADLSTTTQVTYTADWSANEISGIILREFGTVQLGSHFLTRQVLT